MCGFCPPYLDMLFLCLHNQKLGRLYSELLKVADVQNIYIHINLYIKKKNDFSVKVFGQSSN